MSDNFTIIHGDARFQIRNDTLDNWQEKNPVLERGEPSAVVGLHEVGDRLQGETEIFKIGDGIHPWNELPWCKGPTGNTGKQGPSGAIGSRGRSIIKVSKAPVKRNGGPMNGEFATHHLNSRDTPTYVSLFVGDIIEWEHYHYAVIHLNGTDIWLNNETSIKGDKGDAGVIKFIPVTELPTENIDENAIYLVPSNVAQNNNTFDEYVFIDGKPEIIGSATVEINLDDYVKNTDYATTDKAGLMRPASSGLSVSNGGLYLIGATQKNIDAKASTDRPLVPSHLDYAIKVGLTTNTETLTDEEKASACEWLGVNALVGDIETALDSIIAIQERTIAIQEGLIGGDVE